MRALTAVVSVINLVFVAKVFKLGKRNRAADLKREATQRRSDRQLAVDSFWFQDVILQPNKARVLGFFDDLESLLRKFGSELADGKARGASIGDCKEICGANLKEFDKHWADFNAAFVDQVMVFYPKLGEQLRDDMVQIQEINESFDATIVAEPDIERMCENVRRLRATFLRRLKVAHTNPA